MRTKGRRLVEFNAPFNGHIERDAGDKQQVTDLTSIGNLVV